MTEFLEDLQQEAEEAELFKASVLSIGIIFIFLPKFNENNSVHIMYSLNDGAQGHISIQPEDDGKPINLYNMCEGDMLETIINSAININNTPTTETLH